VYDYQIDLIIDYAFRKAKWRVLFMEVRKFI